jgi:hypothetical protein
MLTCGRIEVLFILLFRYIKTLRTQQLSKLAAQVGNGAAKASPVLLK